MLNKKACAVLLAAATTASLLAGCGSSTSSDTSAAASTEASAEASTEETKTYAADAYLSGITASDYVELPDYSEIPVEAALEEVTDEDVEAAIESNLSNDEELVEITDRDTAEEGDVANIDYVGKKDGEAFSGGTASGYDLELGSGIFIDGFEDGVIGMKVGETKTLTLTFPEDYSNDDLAGQETTFDVTLNKIQQYQTPELTASWVAEQDIDGVTTVDEYKAYIRSQLEETAQAAYDETIQASAADYIYNNCTWKQDPPQDLVDRLYDQTIENYETYASYYGVDVDTLLSTIGTSTEELRTNAEDNAKYYICMKAVADVEGLNLTDDEYQEQLESMASEYGYEDGATFEATVGKDEISEYLTLNNVANFLTNNATITAPSEDSAEAATEASTEAATETSASEK